MTIEPDQLELAWVGELVFAAVVAVAVSVGDDAVFEGGISLGIEGEAVVELEPIVDFEDLTTVRLVAGSMR